MFDKIMILHTITKRLIRNGRTRVRLGAHYSSFRGALIQSQDLCADDITARAPQHYGSCLTTFLRPFGSKRTKFERRIVLSLLLMLCLGVSEAWGADTLPFTTSTASNKYYYKINIVVNSPSTNYVLGYYITPSSPYVSTSNVSSDDLIWYMMDANDDDTWGNKSFYFINAVSKEYLYYNGNSTNSVEMRSITDPNAIADRFKFKVRRTQNTSHVSFGISPLELYKANTSLNGGVKDVTQSIFIVGNTAGGDNLKKGHANAWGQQWEFESTSYVPSCKTPTITYNNTTGNVTISSETEGATIYYTMSTSGSEPSAPTSSSYDGTGTTPIVISNVTTPIIYKTIATKTDFEDSEVATQAITQVETPTITLSNGKVQISCTTGGASIYYEIGNTADGVSTPTSSSTPYSGPIENAEGKYIKAIAVKGGWINSAVATSSQISFPCSTPVIRKATATTFTITCSFPTSGCRFLPVNFHSR